MVRGRLEDRDGSLDWVRQAADLGNAPMPEHDTELLVRLTAATISPQEETGLDTEEEALLLSLEHADWLGAIVSLVRGGAGPTPRPMRSSTASATATRSTSRAT